MKRTLILFLIALAAIYLIFTTYVLITGFHFFSQTSLLGFVFFVLFNGFAEMTNHIASPGGILLLLFLLAIIYAWRPKQNKK